MEAGKIIPAACARRRQRGWTAIILHYTTPHPTMQVHLAAVGELLWRLAEAHLHGGVGGTM